MAKLRIVRPITLIWGARQAEGLYLRPAVARWQRQWPDFRFVAALSDGATQEGDDAFAGRVDAALAAHCPELADHEVYACGSPAMVHAVREMALGRCGLDAASFHADVFAEGPAPQTPASRPPALHDTVQRSE